MFFEDWQSILRVIVMSVCSYIALVILLRISGKRTLSKMNSFDFVVTIAFGSTLATIILSSTVPLINGIVALGSLVLLQYIVTFLSVRFKSFDRLVTDTPQILYYNGEFYSKHLKKERVTREEIFAAMREKGLGDSTEVKAVVLETDGTLSVLKNWSESSNTLQT